MNIDNIIRKGELGERLNNKEKEALMLHALDLLKYIETETLSSIDRCNLILQSKCKIAA